jgi:molybdopterin molybdotransferase
LRSPVSVEQYRQNILDRIPEPRPATVPLDAAYGCVLASGLTSPQDLPAFPTSAMDGYALRSEDLATAAEGSPVLLQVDGEVRMGSTAGTEVLEGRAVGVPTGGMMPKGADTVVPVEECRIEGGALHICAPSRPGRNVRPAGEDLSAGGVLVEAGRRLEAADLGALAAAGYAEVGVFPAPRVVIFSTGNELVEGGGATGPGQIHESNSFMLRALVRRAGCEATYAGRVADDPGALLGALESAPPGDVLLCSGGVSAGRDDPVRRAFEGREDVACVQVSVQPGRPQAFGVFGGNPFFGLPGNPMASLVSFELFVRPALNKMMGLPPTVDYLTATLDGPVEAAPVAVRFVPVRLTESGTQLVACSSGRRRSNQLAKLAQSDGMAEVPPGTDLNAGEPVRVLSIRER